MRGLVVSGFTAIGTGTGAMLVLHTEAGLDPAHTVISEYAFQAAGWLLPLSLTLFAFGAALIAEALRRSGADRRVVALLAVWGMCMVLVGAFPTDPPGVPLSVSAGIHRYAAFVAFLVMPLAGLLLARTGIRHARLVRVLSLVALGALVLVVIPYAVRMLGIPLADEDFPAGLIQRTVVVTELGVLWLAGLAAPWRAERSAAAPVLA